MENEKRERQRPKSKKYTSLCKCVGAPVGDEKVGDKADKSLKFKDKRAHQPLCSDTDPGKTGQTKPRGTFRDIDCAGVELPQDELLARISEGMGEILASIDRARARKASLASQSRSPISAVRSRASSDRKRRRAEAHARQRPLLTPQALRREMSESGEWNLTRLDHLLTDDQSDALERWAMCEALLAGRAKTADWEPSYGEPRLPAPIPDWAMIQIGAHIQIRRSLLLNELKVLDAFTAIQNGAESAQSPAQYGLELFPQAQDKRNAFLNALMVVVANLVRSRY